MTKIKDKTVEQLVKEYKTIDQNQLANSIIRAHLKQVESCVMDAAHHGGAQSGLHALSKLQEWLDEFTQDAQTHFDNCSTINQKKKE